MPPLPVIPNTFRVAFEWHDTLNGQNATNVMHFRTDDGDAQNVRDRLDNHVTAAMWEHTYDHAAVFGLRITPLDGTSPTVEFFDLTEDGRWTGSGSSDPIPQSCALVKLLTDQRGRRHRGRVYLPWVKEGSQSGGRLSSTNVSNMQAAWDAFIAGMATAVTPLQVASYRAASSLPVHALVVESETGTQRRRQTRNR